MQLPASSPPPTTAPGYWPTTPPSYGTPAPPPGYGAPGAPAGTMAPSLPPSGAALPPQPNTFAPPAWDPYAEPAQPGAQPYSPYAPSPYAANPGSLPPFGSQPYTTPGTAAPYGTPPGALYPDGLPSVLPENGILQTLREPIKFLQEARLRYTWIPGGNSADDLGLNEIETSASFAVPIVFDQPPLLVTPGFGLHLLDGPVSGPPDFADLPPQVYDAYLDFSWRPQFTSWLGANIGIRPGVYTDFNTFTTHSIRTPGRGLGVITLTPTLQIAAGVVYLDRVKVKLLPAGGVIWTPNADTRWEILFPNPKLATRLTNFANSELWWYVAGEYGGGSWTADRQAGNSDQFDYNDIRVILGLETVGGRMRTFAETGYLFNRELVYRSGSPQQIDLSDAFMLRVGLAF